MRRFGSFILLVGLAVFFSACERKPSGFSRRLISRMEIAGDFESHLFANSGGRTDASNYCAQLTERKDSKGTFYYLEIAATKCPKELIDELDAIILLASYTSTNYSDRTEWQFGVDGFKTFAVAKQPKGAIPELTDICEASSNDTQARLKLDKNCVLKYDGAGILTGLTPR